MKEYGVGGDPSVYQEDHPAKVGNATVHRMNKPFRVTPECLR
jgi:hypothetical protein